MVDSVDFTVVIVNYNGGETVLRAIESVFRQHRKPAAVVVVDNASSDGSADAIRRQFPEVRLALNDSNLGFAAANNQAVRQLCDTPWVALLNPDAYPREDWLIRLNEAVSAYPDYRVFGCLQLDADDPETIDGAGDVYHRSGLAWRRWHGRKVDGQAMRDEDIFAPCAAAAVYHRQTFIEVGGFDESFFCYFEDVDLGFRLQLKGHRARFVAQAVVSHVGSAFTGKSSDFSVYHGHRNLEWTYFKNMPAAHLWLYLPEHILCGLVALLYYTLKGQGGTVIRAKWHALKGLPRVIRQRPREAPPASNTRSTLAAMSGGILTPYLGRSRLRS